MGSKYPGNECSRRAVIGWQNPIAPDDILKSNAALSCKSAVCPHHKDKRLIEQPLRMKVLLLACGSRDQQVNLAFAQLLNLMFARIGQLYVKLNAGILPGEFPHDRRHDAVQNDVGASKPDFSRIRIR